MNHSFQYVSFIFTCVGLWFIFKKAGIPEWKAIIPFYNLYHLVDLSGLKASFFWTRIVPAFIFIFVFPVVVLFLGANVISFVSTLSSGDKSGYGALGFFMALVVLPITITIGAIPFLFYTFKLQIKVGERFGKGKWFAAGLTFLPFIFYPILGFSNALYKKNEKVSTV